MMMMTMLDLCIMMNCLYSFLAMDCQEEEEADDSFDES